MYQKRDALQSEQRRPNSVTEPSISSENLANTPLMQSRQIEQAEKITNRNNTGLPDGLKASIENLSGYSMDDVKVHYNSDKPAKIGAEAYAKGKYIHLATGQEKHLPHEAWHVVQQKQGRVQATTQMKSVQINDSSALEREADVMGDKALSYRGPEVAEGNLRKGSIGGGAPVQGKFVSDTGEINLTDSEIKLIRSIVEEDTKKDGVSDEVKAAGALLLKAIDTQDAISLASYRSGQRLYQWIRDNSRTSGKERSIVLVWAQILISIKSGPEGGAKHLQEALQKTIVEEVYSRDKFRPQKEAFSEKAATAYDVFAPLVGDFANYMGTSPAGFLSSEISKTHWTSGIGASAKWGVTGGSLGLMTAIIDLFRLRIAQKDKELSSIEKAEKWATIVGGINGINTIVGYYASGVIGNINALIGMLTYLIVYIVQIASDFCTIDTLNAENFDRNITGILDEFIANFYKEIDATKDETEKFLEVRAADRSRQVKFSNADKFRMIAHMIGSVIMAILTLFQIFFWCVELSKPTRDDDSKEANNDEESFKLGNWLTAGSWGLQFMSMFGYFFIRTIYRFTDKQLDDDGYVDMHSKVFDLKFKDNKTKRDYYAWKKAKYLFPGIEESDAIIYDFLADNRIKKWVGKTGGVSIDQMYAEANSIRGNAGVQGMLKLLNDKRRSNAAKSGVGTAPRKPDRLSKVIKYCVRHTKELWRHPIIKDHYNYLTGKVLKSDADIEGLDPTSKKVLQDITKKKFEQDKNKGFKQIEIYEKIFRKLDEDALKSTKYSDQQIILYDPRNVIYKASGKTKDGGPQQDFYAINMPK